MQMACQYPIITAKPERTDIESGGVKPGDLVQDLILRRLELKYRIRVSRGSYYACTFRIPKA